MVAEFLEKLPCDQVLSFADAKRGAATERTLSARFRDILDRLPPMILFGELSAPEGDTAPGSPKAAARQIRAHQDQARAKGRKLTTSEAAAELGIL